jgi:type II secretory pathway pseudopilin PulG
LRARGFTLLETLAMSFLALLILAVIVQLFAAVSRGTRRSSEEISLQQRAALVVDRLATDLKSSTATQMLITPEFVAIRPLQDVTPEGEQVWSDQLEVYRYSAEEKALFLGEYVLGESDLNQGRLRLDVTTLQTGDRSERILARGVTEFSLTKGASWQLVLTVESDDGTRDLTVERALFLPLKDR